MIEKHNGYTTVKETVAPVKIIKSSGVTSPEELMNRKETAISFRTDLCASFDGAGSYVILDFGKELCAGLRIITREAKAGTDIRITLGESVSEACSSVGEKGATNDHSPRDFTARLTMLSDLTFGSSGFRFARVELLTDSPALIQNIYAESTLPYFEREATIKTSDRALNKIINTAAYTLKLNFQNGFIWDGIKRDRLVWCGDLHQEVITSLYLFGDSVNIPNSLTFLQNNTLENCWVNNMPPYSAWWVINFCDYCAYTDNTEYYEQHKDYAKQILKQFNNGISENGVMEFESGSFLDWPTHETPDAVIGTAAIIILAAKKYLEFEENSDCRDLIKKLDRYLSAACSFKQTKAFQILAGSSSEDYEFLENNGAAGFSTFMSYYILTADAKAGGRNMLQLIKEYFGGMLSRGATTFWEDFDLEWLKGSSRIDRLPSRGQKDLHGDFGRYCYVGLRHSLCHGWSSGVLAFIIENIFGISYNAKNGTVRISPSETCPGFKLKMPLKKGWLRVTFKNGDLEIKAPEGVKLI